MQSTYCNPLKQFGTICFKNTKRKCWILHRSCLLFPVLCARVCVYTHTHTHIYTYAYIYISHAHIYVYIHTHTYICIHIKNRAVEKAHQSTWKMKVSSKHIKAHISGIPLCFTRDVTALLVWLCDTLNEYVIKGQSLQQNYRYEICRICQRDKGRDL